MAFQELTDAKVIADMRTTNLLWYQPLHAREPLPLLDVAMASPDLIQKYALDTGLRYFMLLED